MALPQFSEEHFAGFDTLTAPIRAAFGPFDPEMIAEPGSFNLVSRKRDGLFVTCGLANEPGRHASAEGFAYELIMFTSEAVETVQAILTYVAVSHADAPLEDGGLASVAGIGDLPSDTVRFTKFAEGPAGGALYQVSFA